MRTPLFIGRQAQLAQIELDAEATHGCLLLIAGEPGIGKTRLCAELLVRRPELRAAWGRCMAGDITPPYWPFIQVFRELAVERPPPEPLAGLLDLSAPYGGGDVSGQFALFDTAVRWLAGFTQRRALLLDDLQWADQSSLRLLEFLAVQLAGLSLLVIGTYREDEVHDEPARETALSRIARSGSLIRLGGLGDQESAQLIRQLAPEASDARVRALARATAGNPFFLGELASTPEGATLPASVRHALSVRLARLDRNAAALLGVAAVLGHEFDLGTLEAVWGQGPAAGPVDALVSSGWLLTLERVPPRHAFVHDLAREAALGSLGSQERARLHLRAAEVLAQRGSAAPPALIAHHRLSALPLGDVELAIRASVEAAQRELDGWAFDEAIAHLERAICAVGNRSLLDRADLRKQLGRALIRSGDAGRGREVCLAAAEDAQAAGSARGVCEAALALGEASTFGAVDQALVEVLNRGLALPEANDPGLRARMLGRLAAALMPAPDPAMPSRMAQEAIALARASGDPAALLATLVAARGALTNLDPIELMLGIDQEALQLARAAGDRRAEMQTRLRLMQDHVTTWDMGRLRAELAEFEHGLSAHDLLNREQAHLLRFTLETATGAFAAAEAQLGEVQALHTRMKAPAGLRLSVRPVQLARVALLRLRGSPEDLKELGALRIGGFAAEPFGLMRELMAGDESAARARLDRLIHDGLVQRYPYISYAILPEAVWQLEHRAGAEALVAIGARTQVRGYLFPTAGVCSGAAERLEALIAVVRAEAEAADALFARALERNAAAGCAALAAITRYQWALSLRRLGRDSARADALLAAATLAFTELGMPWWSASAAAAGPAPAPLPHRARLSMRLEEGAWRIEYDGDRLHCEDNHGLRYLDLLVARPGVALTVRELYEALHGEGTAGPASDAGQHLDERAIRTYKARLEELTEAMQTSRSRGALERHERQRAEFESIVAELRRAQGLGGRARVAGSRDERLRVNLTQRIRGAIRKIAEKNPTLAHHLDACVRTGATCVYVPSPGDDVTRTE